ncbi:MAG: cytochrome b/b6 domain-containing protein [Solirubrobacteraceae bacterium]|nr:cytochrome b/b6 domain-containing protein [Solirubrobacteraceae bacterium]
MAVETLPAVGRRVHRFSVTERALHGIHATAFTIMLGSGLVLFLPVLSQVFGNRPVVKAVHLAVAALWLTALLLVAILGDQRILRRTRRQFESLSRDDLRWLRSAAARAEPQGRFNGGQKLNAIVQSAFTLLFFVSGTLMWLGERNTTFRLPGTIALHDLTMVAATGFVIGHVAIALSRTGRPALSGLADGTVPATYAQVHHGAWNPADEPVEQHGLSPQRALAAGVVAVAGVIAAALLAGVG